MIKWIFALCLLSLGLVSLVACGALTLENDAPSEVSYPVAEFPTTIEDVSLPKQNSTGLPLKAVWLSYLEFDHMLKGKTEQSFTKSVQQMMIHLKERNLNTLFVQLRSHGDAYYPSKVYPWSYYASGAVAVPCGFDPTEILLREAKEQEIAVHIWVNLFRLMKPAELEQVPQEYRIATWYSDKNTMNEFMKQGDDGFYYLNPASDKVQQLILDGVDEALERYDFAGVQVDDYFYHKITPTDFGNTQLEGREAISKLIQGLYTTVKKHGNELLFGVSPSGNFKDDGPVSDQTQGTDLARWCTENGYLDYLAPQVYWGEDDADAPFVEIVNRWVRFMKQYDKKLYIGLAAYKFPDDDTISRQVAKLEQQPTIDGFIMFRYDFVQ